MLKHFLTFLLLSFAIHAIAQDDLEDLLDSEMENTVEEAKATFKGTRVINGQSVERMPKGGLDFRVSHRFGLVNQGFHELFGLDYASSYFSLEYGITDRFMLGLGRETFEKTWSGSFKAGIMKQKKGAEFFPVTLVWYSNMSVIGYQYRDQERNEDFSARLAYTHQLLIARKFGPKLSFQLSPTFLHRNMVATPEQNNNLYALGMGGRYLITKRMALNMEYHHVFGLEPTSYNNYYSPLAMGIDIQVSGHVFQIHVTNAEAMTESGFLGKTTSDFFSGDIRIGFNIQTVLALD